jgi:hemerythrin-like metal-binding protein
MNKYTLIWNDELHSIGIASLDSQHQEIVKLVNQIADTVAKGPISGAMVPLVNDLIRVSQAHFTLEQELMEKYGFPDLQNHVVEHLELLQQLKNLYEDIVGSKRERAGLISAFLCDWTEIHILKSDKMLGNFLIAKGLS